MEKKLLALAVAGLTSATAFAQSNVTIYGSADMYYGHSKTTGKQAQNVIGDGGYNPTRVGFKGTEDLGDGFKALFLLEYWTGAPNNADTNTGLTAARQQYVGIDSPYGAVTAGFQYNPGADIAGDNAPSTVVGVYASNELQSAMDDAGANLRTAATKSRWANSIKYQSPTWNGLKFALHYSAGEKANTNNAYTNSTDSKYGANIRYANGPLGLDAAYILQADKSLGVSNNGAATTQYDIREWYVGGRYDFGFTKLFGSYQTLRNEATTIAAYNFDAWQTGVKIPFADNKQAINLEFAKISWDPANSLAVQSATGSSKAYSIGYELNLSKRTLLYTAATHTRNGSNIPTATSASTTNTMYWNTEKQGVGATNTVSAGTSTNSFMVGMRHWF